MISKNSSAPLTTTSSQHRPLETQPHAAQPRETMRRLIGVPAVGLAILLLLISSVAGLRPASAQPPVADPEGQPGEGSPDVTVRAGENACNLERLPGLRDALQLELQEEFALVQLEAVPCEDPLFYRVRIRDEVAILPRTAEGDAESRFLALAIAHLLEETRPPPPPEPWVDPRPIATDDDTARWWPSSEIFRTHERPITQAELRIGGVFSTGAAGAGWLSVRGRFRRSTLGVETEGYVGARGDDRFRKLSARAFVGWDLDFVGFELEGGVITPRRTEGTSFAPAFGLRARFGFLDAAEVNVGIQLAAVGGSVVFNEARLSVLAPITLRWRLDAGGTYQRQTSVARIFVGAFRWLRGYGGAGSFALGARVGAALLARRDGCGGPCEDDPSETSEVRYFGGLNVEFTLRRYF